MREIVLTQGKVALVDEADFGWLNQFKWYAVWKPCTKSFYARRSIRDKKTGVGQTICMAREVLGLKRGDKRQADHIKHATLDNRRCNLRICTQGQNLFNSNKYKNGATSCFKGVYWNKQRKAYRATIGLNGKRIYLGYYDNEHDAALAYDKAAMKYFGEFAKFNVA